MEYATQFLIDLQFDDQEAQAFSSPDRVKGGTPLNHSEDNIRIDYVQHAVVVVAKVMVYRSTELNI